jgi:outer membrane protein assembly factor BamA
MAIIRGARELVLRRGAAVVLALLLAVVCAAAQEPSAVAELSHANDLQGMRVAQVEFRGVEANPAVLENLRRLVAPNLDQPLDRQRLGRTLRDLYATGRFANVQVDAQRNPRNELSLVFMATENLFIGSITVAGAPRRPL